MLTKPNFVRLVAFTLAFFGALYYPVRNILYYERTEPREFRYLVTEAQRNENRIEIRPNVSESGRWKWLDYIFPRGEDPNKLRLKLVSLGDPNAPRLSYIYYPMSRELAEKTLPRVKGGRAELVIKCYPNGRWLIGDLLIDGIPVKETKVGGN